MSYSASRLVLPWVLLLAACSDTTPPPKPPAAAPPPGKTVVVFLPAPPAGPPAAEPAGPPGDVAGAEQDRRTTERRGRVLKEVEAYYPQMTKCYTDGHDKNAALVGRVTVKFTVAPNGQVVQTADVGSTLPDPAVIACMLGVFSSMKLTPWEGKSVTAVLPIDLSTKIENL